MAKNKTTETSASVTDFINAVDNEQKRADSYRLIELMQKVTGHGPKMWGPGIIGFGSYHYRYASGHEGDAPLLGFSPRKPAISLYVVCGDGNEKHLLEGLGKYKMSKACIYVKKLADLNEDVLVRLMEASMRHTQKKYPG